MKQVHDHSFMAVHLRSLFAYNGHEDCCPAMREAVLVSSIYANSEPQPNAKYSCAASVAIAR
ncbi:hypothetical protein ACTQ1O_04245 [Bilifractor sp. LCP21S3_A7]|uniref:hypothetical protein n=1 Tax=Bilifractor sp. LCP21S3_A7 TaxID=3438738 RepID=UPI003F9207E3